MADEQEVPKTAVGQIVESFPIALIKETFNVRQALDARRVEHFVMLYKTRVDLGPLEIDVVTLELLDGRTRLAALREIEYTTCKVVFVKHMERDEQLAYALNKNLGGPLPPKQVDIIKTFADMIRAGSRIADFRKKFVPRWTAEYVSKMYNLAYSRLGRQKVRDALAAMVSDNLSVADAAEKFDVKPETLKKELGDNSKSEDDLSELNPAQVKSTLSHLNRSNSQSVFALVNNVVTAYEEGFLSEDAAQTILDHQYKKLKSTRASMDEAQLRFDNARVSQRGLKSLAELPVKQKRKRK